MKKFFLLIFFTSALNGGPPFLQDSLISLNEFYCRLQQLKTRANFNLPEDETPEELTYEESVEIFEKFISLWKQFQEEREILRVRISKSPPRQKLFGQLARDFAISKRKFERWECRYQAQEQNTQDDA